MTQDRTTRTIVALLTLAVLLVGVFAIHSEATGHNMHGSMSASVSHHDEAAGLTDLAMAGTAVATLTAGADDGFLDCALLAMTCVLLLTLVISVFLTRRPATYRRLLEAGGAALGVTRRPAARPAARPSLIQLSISRV